MDVYREKAYIWTWVEKDSVYRKASSYKGLTEIKKGYKKSDLYSVFLTETLLTERERQSMTERKDLKSSMKKDYGISFVHTC